MTAKKGDIPIISVVGLQKSGKTTTVERLVKRLVEMGYKVGTIKSMVHSNFTIDVEGKDTYRHKQAGADFVISLSRNETAYIENNPRRQDVGEVSRLFPDGTDIVVGEGLYDTGPRIYQLVACRSSETIEDTFKVRNIGDNVVALTGIMSNEIVEHPLYPVFNATNPKDLEAVVELLLERIGSATERNAEMEETK